MCQPTYILVHYKQFSRLAGHIMCTLNMPAEIYASLLQAVQPNSWEYYACSNHASLLRVSALHYSGRDWVMEGFWTVASAHALCQPTSCGSKYLYSQCPQVQNLIGTEHSLNRSEHRFKSEASK